jgi:hypothetical protein
VLRESQQGPEAEGPAQSTAPAVQAAPGNSAPLALARMIAAQKLGNRATQALIARDSFSKAGSTEELHEQIYGDSSLAHAPSPQPKYEFSDDAPIDFDYVPGTSIRVKPGPVRADLIKPKLGPDLGPKKNWLKDALQKDPVLKALPDWARDKAIGALEDIDETIAEKIIDALPWDAQVKGAATAALKALLQTAKGKKFEIPPAPPATRAPDWSRQPDFQPSPGQVIIPGPVIKW